MPRVMMGSQEHRNRESRIGFNLVAWENGRSKEAAWIRGVEEIYSLGVRRVTIVPYWFVDPATAKIHKLSRHGLPHGPSQDAVFAALRVARDLGMGVSLKPMVEIDHSASLADLWRGDLKLNNRLLKTFFEYYDSYILEMAALGRETNIERFYVGSELLSLTANDAATPYWSNLIAKTRQTLSEGKTRISYAANYNEYQKVPFWSELDDIGIDAYFHLASRDEARGAGRPDVDTLTRRWRKVFGKLHEFSADWDRPIVFSEFGVIPYEFASCEPWEWRPRKLKSKNGKRTKPDPSEQLHAFQALLIAMQDDSDWLTAVDFWHWQLPGSPGSLYNINRQTPVGKLIAEYAAEVQ